jgi:hypothetical protein
MVLIVDRVNFQSGSDRKNYQYFLEKLYDAPLPNVTVSLLVS